MPFGAVGGVLAWWRVAAALRQIGRMLFELVLFVYVDDTQVTEPAVSAQEAQKLWQSLVRLLGWELDQAKSVPMCTDTVSLGCRIQIGEEGITWSVSEDKRRQWSRDIQEILWTEGELGSARAGQL